MQQVLNMATAFGSLVLVAVTIWYAWQTQHMVREMREARVASLRPSVQLDLGVIGGTAYVEVVNVGVGPATDISATLVVETDEGELESHNWTRALLRSGESQTMLVPRGSGGLMDLSTLKKMGVRTRMTGTCLDLDGREHVIDDTLSFAILGDRSPEGEWEGVDDRWPKNVEKIAKELEGIRALLKSDENPWRGA